MEHAYHYASVGTHFYSKGLTSHTEYSTTVASLAEWSMSETLKHRIASELSKKSLFPAIDSDDESEESKASDDLTIQYNTRELSEKNKLSCHRDRM